MDQRIREEQAGFTAGRGCSDQNFALRNIVEQCLEWNAPVFFNFVDLRKAFESFHRDTLWAVIRHYGLPQKVSLMKLFYERFDCGLILREGVSGFFEVQAGVRKEFMLSPLLFLILIDYVMRKGMANCEACEARNQCIQNERDVYQRLLRCISQDRGRYARICR